MRKRKVSVVFLSILLASCSQPESESLLTSDIRSTNTVVSWSGERVDVEVDLESIRSEDVESDVKLSGGDYLEVETVMGLSRLTGSVSQVGITYTYATSINLPENALDVLVRFVRPERGEWSESSVMLPEPFNIDMPSSNQFSVGESLVLTWSPANPESNIIVDVSPNEFRVGSRIDGGNTLYRKHIPDSGEYVIPLSVVFSGMDMSNSALQRNQILLIRESEGALSGDFNGGYISGYQVRGVSLSVSE